MRFLITIFILLCVSLSARENPFEAVSASNSTGKATYKKDTRENFSSTKVQLPSSARILKSVEFHFQNLDGSIESKKVAVDNKIDWHDELIVKKLLDDVTTTTAPTLVSTKKPTNKVKKINK